MSMNTGLLSELIIFAIGAAAGSVVTYALMKRKQNIAEYEDYYVEDEVKEEKPESACTKKNEEEKTNESNMVQYNKIVKQYSGSDEKKEEKEQEVEDMERPYVISVNEYAEIEEYETETLYYYADDVLTDEEDNIIDDVDDIVGEEALKEFDRNPDCDSVYVRNDARQTDYEILRDFNNYSDKYHVEV